MAEESKGLITTETVAKLAALFERYHDALDPDAPSAREAEVDFNREAEKLHTLAKEKGFEVPLSKFKAHLRINVDCTSVRIRIRIS